jgi:hypothetical protein
MIAQLFDVCHEVVETDERRAYTVCGLVIPVRYAEPGLIRRVNCHECKATVNAATTTRRAASVETRRFGA